MTMTEPVIAAAGVNHYFGKGSLRKQILFEISVAVQPGEIVILTGPSGSGKTTLLTLSGALRSIDEGSMKVLGQELNGAPEAALKRVRQDIGFIFQAHNLINALTAAQNVQMSFQLERNHKSTDAREACVKALEAVGLGDRIDYHAGQLSGGQRQRVAIARALVRSPKIVLADEPTAALDKTTGREVVDILRQMAKDRGCAILLVTHDNRILDVADRILTLEDGRIVSFTTGIAANAENLLGAFASLHKRGELFHYVRNLNDSQFIDVAERSTHEFESLLHTLDLGNAAAVRALVDELLEAFAMKIRERLQAERVTIFVLNRAKGTLHSRMTLQEDGSSTEIEIPINSGIAGHVARTGETMNVPDAYSHPEFNRDVDAKTGFRTRNILCMAIKDMHQHVFGVAQLLNKKDAVAFSGEDERNFNEFSGALGLIVESWIRLRNRQAETA
jgi:putative ABC transport system ATP-binding protein